MIGTCTICSGEAPDDWLCTACRARAVDSYLVVSEEIAGAEPSYAVDIFEELASLEERSFWFRNRNRLLVWALQRFFPEARRLLEIGCGSGFVLAALRDTVPEMEIVGAELYTGGLTVARRRLPGVPLFRADARALQIEGVFDVVGAFDVIEHIDDDEGALARMERAVTPGGGLLLTVPQHRWLWSAADDFGAHQRRYSRGELVGKVEAAGFQPLFVTSFVSLLLPLMAIDRLRPRAAEYDFRREFRRAPWLDRILDRVLALEQTVIRRGVSLPWGGSLLLVARRRS